MVQIIAIKIIHTKQVPSRESQPSNQRMFFHLYLANTCRQDKTKQLG
ncbi:hypothetical protein VCR14J2_260350 [Vibrio coralliirubri]|nr:hypothetical protein VCR14J2_260350 [Vibrio coralliirubri]